MRDLSGLLWGVALVALCGCGDRDGEENLFGCLVDATEALDGLDVAPAGFTQTPQAALDATVGVFEGTVTREGGGEQAITLTVNAMGPVQVERRSWQGDQELAMDGDCLDNYVFDAGFGLVSGTALDEAAEGAVRVATDGAGAFALQIDLADLQGDIAPVSFDPAEMDDTWLTVSAETDLEGGWTGDIGFVGEVVEEEGPDGSAMATMDPWGAFSVAP